MSDEVVVSVFRLFFVGFLWPALHSYLASGANHIASLKSLSRKLLKSVIIRIL